MRPKEPGFKSLKSAIRKELSKKQALPGPPLTAVIRQIRDQNRLSAVEVCKRAGDLDPKTLNALEKGRIQNPSIKTLQSVARGLGVTVSHLFLQTEVQKEANFYLSTQKGAYQLEFPAYGLRMVSFTPLNRDFFCGKFMLGPKRKLDQAVFRHPYPIHLSMLIGRMQLQIGTKPISIKEGENLFFNGIFDYSFYNPLERDAVFLLVTAPSFL